MKYDVAIVIGRFQPFHRGHQKVIEHAYSVAKDVHILIGSAYSARTTRNPFTFAERASMIEESFPDAIVDPLIDYPYNDELWAEQVQIFARVEDSVVLVGHDKDASSSYLKMFPQYDLVGCPSYHGGISATEIREEYFLQENILYSKITPSTARFLQEFSRKREFFDLQRWFEYDKSYNPAVYPIIMTTVDAVVVCSGHVLLVERGEYPGKGLLALPGGFIHPDETLLQAVVRELKEETHLKMPEKAIRGNLKSQHVFDSPSRSTRGRVITHAFFFHLDPGKLPEVRGGDDAKKAMWVPLSEVQSSQMFEDHYHIIKHFV